MYAKQRRTFGAIFAIVIASYSVPVLAIDDSSRAAARTLVNDGADFFKQGRFEEARRKFMDAYEVVKVPTVAVWAAQAHEKLGKLVAASELCESALLLQPNDLWVGNAQQQAQEQAQKALKVLRPRIPTLKITLVGATASETEVTVDNVKVPSALVSLARPVDPGSHSVTASKGGKTVTQTVALVEAQQGSVTLNVPQTDVPVAAAVPAAAASAQPAAGNAPPASGVPAATPTAANPATPEQAPLVPAVMQPVNQGATESSSGGRLQRTLGWIGVGVGAAGLALGTGSAIYVAAKRSQLHHDGCQGNECFNDSFSTGVKQYNAGRTLSTVGFVVGGVCTAAGLTLLLTSPKRESVPPMGLVIGPGNIALTGAL